MVVEDEITIRFLEHLASHKHTLSQAFVGSLRGIFKSTVMAVGSKLTLPLCHLSPASLIVIHGETKSRILQHSCLLRTQEHTRNKAFEMGFMASAGAAFNK